MTQSYDKKNEKRGVGLGRKYEFTGCITPETTTEINDIGTTDGFQPILDRRNFAIRRYLIYRRLWPIMTGIIDDEPAVQEPPPNGALIQTTA